ncbi:MAG TPA: 4'-phosphopantetheinyl transferase superfamily protein [Bryobacteraceae bacterium]|nr:4'-phosphopantetheinyl transferase superfamily protein [Bryobacteraceae bacterium]
MPQPGDCEIHVWDIDLDAVSDGAAVLSHDERMRAARFRFDVHRARFVAGRAALRTILASYVGLAPAEIAFEYNRFGKPELAGGTRLRFNASHSSGRQLIAIACGREVGVDLERVRADFAFEDIVRRFFPPEERAAVSDAESFFSTWTRREAFLKATGQGLSGLRTAVPPSWTVANLDAGEGWAAAIAVKGGECRVIRRVFSI